MTDQHSSAPTRTLPERPSFTQLRKQAKELRKAFIAGETAAVNEVNAHFHDPDPVSFKVSEAQLVLARAYGFASWAELKKKVETKKKKPFPLYPKVDVEHTHGEDLHKALQASDPDAITRIHEYHPKFADAKKADLVGATVSLDDCLLVIAQEYGFDTWSKLKAFIDMVNSHISNPEVEGRLNNY